MGRFNFSDVVPLNVPTQAQADSSTKAANTAFVQTLVGNLPTPAQFDNSTKAANTAFVQRALGNFQGIQNYSANQTLLASQSGSLIECTGSTAFTLTLPAPTVNLTYTILNTLSSATVTLTTPSGNIFYVGAAASSVSVSPSTSLQVVSDGINWIAINGNGASTLASNGYQKLPSGLIIQWGVGTTNGSGLLTQTLPLAFPNAWFSGFATCELNANTVCSVASLNATSISIVAFTGNTAAAATSQNVCWLALGR